MKSPSIGNASVDLALAGLSSFFPLLQFWVQEHGYQLHPQTARCLCTGVSPKQTGATPHSVRILTFSRQVWGAVSAWLKWKHEPTSTHRAKIEYGNQTSASEEFIRCWFFSSCFYLCVTFLCQLPTSINKFILAHKKNKKTGQRPSSCYFESCGVLITGHIYFLIY